MTVGNKEIADVLASIASLLEVDRGDAFRIRAYRNAADNIRFLDPPLARMVADGEDLTQLEGIGSGIAKKIQEIVKLGRHAYIAKMEEESSPGLLELLRLPGLGPGKVRALRDGLGVRSLDDLRKALEEGRLGEVAGFGPKSVERLRERLEHTE